jgi:hypothetical protein
MKILVKKPSDVERQVMLKNPTWGCGVSEFDWHYDDEEHALIIDGEVTVKYGEGNREGIAFGAGDYVVFPKGLSCRWVVTKPVKKHYEFR